MCEANEQLQQARYELDIMIGKGVLDYGRLKQILSQGEHETGANHH